METYAVAFGVVLFAVATLVRARISRSVRSVLAGVPAAGLIAILLSTTAYADHTIITSATFGWFPTPWNGYKVYLSAPTHADSGHRGECGWEENINGRYFNVYAASVFTQGAGSFFDRGYYVITSGNPRDDSYVSHVTYANNWGAQIYIVTQTNAQSGGCGGSASYLLVMYDGGSATSETLKTQLISALDGATPGANNSWPCTDYECTNPWAWYRSYVELFFHTNTAAKNWFQGSGAEGAGGVTESWRYGYAVDVILGYPR